MTKFSWTFEPRDVIEFTEGERFIQVFAPTYDKAIKKVLKLKLPKIESEEDLRFVSVQEEAFGDDDDTVLQTEN